MMHKFKPVAVLFASLLTIAPPSAHNSIASPLTSAELPKQTSFRFNVLVADKAALSASSRWCSPFQRSKLTRRFEAPAHAYGSGHRGIDLRSSSASDAVRAPADAIVHFVGKVVDRPVISLRLDSDTIVSIEPVESDLQKGDAVERCAVLGTVFGAGHTQPDEIHFGVRVSEEYVNPAQFLFPRPILLPLEQE